MLKERKPQYKDMTDFFRQEMIKEAADKGHKITVNVASQKEKSEPKAPKGYDPTQASAQPVEQMPPEAAQAGQPMTGQPTDPMAAQMGQQAGQPQMVDQTGMPMPGQQVLPPMSSNNLRQSGLPTTAIVCTSDCVYAQNEKGMCSLNKINLNQVRDGVFQCENYEQVMTEPLVGAQQ